MFLSARTCLVGTQLFNCPNTWANKSAGLGEQREIQPVSTTDSEGGKRERGKGDSVHSFTEMWHEVTLWEMMAINHSYWIQSTQLMTINLRDESQENGPVCQLQSGPQNVQNHTKRQRTKGKMKARGRPKGNQILYCCIVIMSRLRFHADYRKLPNKGHIRNQLQRCTIREIFFFFFSFFLLVSGAAVTSPWASEAQVVFSMYDLTSLGSVSIQACAGWQLSWARGKSRTIKFTL